MSFPSLLRRFAVGTWLLGAAVSLGLSTGSAQTAPVVRVRVAYGGKAPKIVLLKREPECGGTRWSPEEELSVSQNGGLRNVLVYVSRGAPPVRPRELELTHTQCVMKPRIAAVVAGSAVRISNGDEMLHHVHTFRGVKTVAHNRHPAGAAPLVHDYKDHVGEFLRVRCDLHPSTLAYVHVLETHVFGVTNEQGEVMLTDLPPGTYTLTAWHERFGSKKVDVTVTDQGGDVKIVYDGTEGHP